MQTVHASSRALQIHHVSAGWLWVAVLWGPLAAFANEQFGYLIVSWSCGKLDPVLRILAHAVPLALFVGCGVAALVAWKGRPRPLDASDDHMTDPDRSRRGFMVYLALGLNLLGALVVLAQWIPVLYFSPCSIL